MKFILTALSLALVIVYSLLQAEFWGQVPLSPHIKELEKSKYFNSTTHQFENRQKDLHRRMNKENFNMTTLPATLKKWMNNDQGVPNQKLPWIKPNFEKFKNGEGGLKVIWFGHSTFLLNINSKNILVDPVFSKSASPFNFLAPRFQDPPVSLQELPQLDFILISHDHYDHLDMKTIRFFKDEKLTFVVPLGVGSHLMSWGIAKDKIIEMDWWEEKMLAGVKFVCTPSQHFSGRDLFNSNKTLWSSWVIQSEKHNLYFSGDSGYDVHFKQIGEKYGPFQIAFMETGQYNELWRAIHMMPIDGVKAFKDLNAKYYFPIHWGMFELSIHPWFEPIQEMQRFSQEMNFNLLAPKLGQVVDFDLIDSEDFGSWWSPIID